MNRVVHLPCTDCHSRLLAALISKRSRSIEMVSFRRTATFHQAVTRSRTTTALTFRRARKLFDTVTTTCLFHPFSIKENLVVGDLVGRRKFPRRMEFASRKVRVFPGYHDRNEYFYFRLSRRKKLTLAFFRRSIVPFCGRPSGFTILRVFLSAHSFLVVFFSLYSIYSYPRKKLYAKKIWLQRCTVACVILRRSMPPFHRGFCRFPSCFS